MGDITACWKQCSSARHLHHNLKLWFRTYPFHFGLYMLMGGTIILVVAASCACSA